MGDGYDAIVVGGGHNGLVTAAYLAKAGRRVVVLERRDTLGGAAATEEILPGMRVNTGAPDAGNLLPEVVRDLDLAAHGLELVHPPAAVCALQPGTRHLTLWRDVERSQSEIEPWSEADARQYPDFVSYVDTMAAALRPVLTLTPPETHSASLRELLRWLRPALRLKGMGRQSMMEFLRVLPMSVSELLDDWFESDALKGALVGSGVLGRMRGPMAAGTVFTLLHHSLGKPNGGFRAAAFVRGGMGRLSEALALAAAQHGAEVRVGSTVERFLVEDERVTGVQLASGDELRARWVISSVDPRRTFHGLLGPLHLGPRFNRRVQSVRLRGSTSAMHIVLQGLPLPTGVDDPDRLTGHLVVCPSVAYLEHAYDDAKYGRVSSAPALDMVIPTLADPDLTRDGSHVLSVYVRYTPYDLRGAEWDRERDALSASVFAVLERYVPGIRDKVLHTHLITPQDWERDYGLTEGGSDHGQMDLDQLLFMRPVPGWGRYRTPLAGLYMCGAGTHPGGGVTGAPGYNAAREILRDD